MDYDEAKKYLLRILSKKGYFSAELAKKLRERGVEQEVSEQLLQEFAEKGYINDQDWMESFTRSRINKHESPSRIKLKLRSRGVSGQSADAALSQYIEDETSSDSIAYLLKTRYRNRDLSDFHEKQKVIASLMRKGFSFDDIKEKIEQDKGT